MFIILYTIIEKQEYHELSTRGDLLTWTCIHLACRETSQWQGGCTV